ncbi:hypothetical protein PH213_37165 [Streptomyces sp. SRF1]|uniref:hypothetical protein n=1 Tax=Streptomyces sp. SRF1 TaxID=1549642 RepID=UPI0025B16C19|nr:hypothetical protein [Streptomyces sp. SRF1]MDN3060053.1 hypothetical protein [Streptomyces sp. SRF1]
MIFEGRVWKVGDNIGATDLVSARHDKAGMQRQWDECAQHLLEDVDPAIAREIQPGDILVAGQNLGTGHAHYYMAAIMGSAASGLSALLADSVNALFLRAAVDAGVTVWSLPGISRFVDSGDRLHIDLRTGHAENRTQHTHQQFPPVGDAVLQILDAGGSRNWALRAVGAAHAIR